VFRDGKAVITAERAGILNRLGSTAESWKARTSFVTRDLQAMRPEAVNFPSKCNPFCAAICHPACNCIDRPSKPLSEPPKASSMAAASGSGINPAQSTFKSNLMYTIYKALDPFFDVVRRGLTGLVDGEHYFDTIVDDVVFEFRYDFPGWPQKITGRGNLMALYAGYGNNIVLHGADALVVHRSQDSRITIIEYEVHGRAVRTGRLYVNRFISVITIEDRKIVHWRDYMDSLAAMTALVAEGS
jgi:uncharacterized protein